MSAQPQIRGALSRLLRGELEAIRSLLGKPESGGGPDGATSDAAPSLPENLEERLPELADPEALAESLAGVASWSWYRFANRHAAHARYLEELLQGADTDLGPDLARRLEALRDAMAELRAALQGSWIDVRFDESDPDIKRQMERRLADGLHRVGRGITDVAAHLEEAGDGGG